MKDPRPAIQLPLFDSDLPNWQSLSHLDQQSILDVLAQMLIAVLEQHEHESFCPTYSEDDDVS